MQNITQTNQHTPQNTLKILLYIITHIYFTIKILGIKNHVLCNMRVLQQSHDP